MSGWSKEQYSKQAIVFEASEVDEFMRNAPNTTPYIEIKASIGPSLFGLDLNIGCCIRCISHTFVNFTCFENDRLFRFLVLHPYSHKTWDIFSRSKCSPGCHLVWYCPMMVYIPIELLGGYNSFRTSLKYSEKARSFEIRTLHFNIAVFWSFKNTHSNV